MAETDRRSPRILDCGWGRIQVDGHGTMKDAKLYYTIACVIYDGVEGGYVGSCNFTAVT